MWYNRCMEVFLWDKVDTLTEQVRRLQEVVAKLATELDEHWDYIHHHNQQQVLRPDPIPSAEEMVEMTLYPEHFQRSEE